MPGETSRQMRQEYATVDKTLYLRLSKSSWTPGSRTASPSCDKVANTVKISSDAVKTLIQQLRKPFTTPLARRGGPSISYLGRIHASLRGLNFSRRAKHMKIENRCMCPSCRKDFSAAIGFCPRMHCLRASACFKLSLWCKDGRTSLTPHTGGADEELSQA